jgi:formylglycine-generating enzyme required for sulfatase activity
MRALLVALLLVAPAGAQDADPAASARAAAERGAPVAEREFRDCDGCPLMVAVPAWSFVLGPPGEDWLGDEGPMSTITAVARAERERKAPPAAEGPPRSIAVPASAVGKLEVTNGEWEACVEDGACIAVWPPDERRDAPRSAVSWIDAATYVLWLSEKTGREYRLLGEAEWEHAARGGSAGDFAQCASPGGRTNAFGLSDMHGSLSEWVGDCADASLEAGSCRRVMRGAPWDYGSGRRTSGCRLIDSGLIRYDHVGFRVARSF